MTDGASQGGGYTHSSYAALGHCNILRYWAAVAWGGERPRDPYYPGRPLSFDLGNGISLDMVWIPPGTFLMGSPENEAERWHNETQHIVTLTKGFWMGKYEVTQEQWQSVMGENLCKVKEARLPVSNVTWYQCHEFVKKLNERLQTADRRLQTFRLPTEAEWEYACRAGTTGPFAGDDLDAMAWHFWNRGGHLHPVGLKRPNAWGLHDMHGNVSEWCLDFYGDYPRKAVTDPTGVVVQCPEYALDIEHCVIRGGASYNCRSAYRNQSWPCYQWGDVGLRVVLAAPVS